MPKLDLLYPAILNLFGNYADKGRTESKAFLAWFLENYYHLESTEVDDAICDEDWDKGLDGIYVSDLLQQIDVFQTKMGKKTPVQNLGDTDLKEFLGTLTQLNSKESTDNLIATTKSPALKALLERLQISKLVADGYQVRGVFITNRVRDPEAVALLKETPNLVLFDNGELEKQYLPINKPEPIANPAVLSTVGVGVLKHSVAPGVEMIVAPLLATDLVKLEGIANQELFAWNLRYQLKRSPVNKEIDKSIGDAKEHKFFPAFHNGLTVLAETATHGENKITIKGYAVVNGCQSLSALYNSSLKLTPDLRILTKIVSVSPKSELALKITDHTNRQNGITGRDLQSNNLLQTRLQSDIHAKYHGKVFYRIARGEHPEWDESKVIENDEMARVILAFDLREPESCHQTYKLFDELHSRIFGRLEINAGRIVAFSEIDATIRLQLGSMEDKLFATYSLTPFLIHYLLREVLELSESGGLDFCQNPSAFADTDDNRTRLRYAITAPVDAVINMVAAEMKRRKEEGNEFDHKKDLKSPTKIKELRSKIIPLYQMAVNSKFTLPFATTWAASKTEAFVPKA